jgi:hypothetical protein
MEGRTKARLKWLPLRPEDGGDGWLLGVNIELSRGFDSFLNLVRSTRSVTPAGPPQPACPPILVVSYRYSRKPYPT